MALLEPLYRLSEICSEHGVKTAIISPGSRSAALTLAFARNKRIKTIPIIDERSAGFVALGMAQISQKPVVLICTSGTAALNYAPAVSEAFFQKIPLLILTADRPPEWINQHDGQTIFQQNIYGKHILKSYEFPVDYSHPDSTWQIERQANEALALAQNGPVHINIPIREPFYPSENETYMGKHRKVEYLSSEKRLSEEIWQNLIQAAENISEIIIAIGQNQQNLNKSLAQLSKNPKISIWADIISNVQIGNKISSHDIFLSQAGKTNTPLLITLGKSFISKPFKLYFRNNPPAAHWHVEDEKELIDPLKSISLKVPVDTGYFLEEFSKRLNPGNNEEKASHWSELETKTQKYLKNFLKDHEWSELKATFTVLNSLKEGDILHLGNSMPVRYANYLNAFLPKGVQVYANRGTSGIDGLVSTAVGLALASNTSVNCIVGDVSFFYDSNAIFAAKPKNLNIFLMNNGGGNIFRNIDGPTRQPELESHFLTPPRRTAQSMAKDAGYTYFPIHSNTELISALSQKPDKPKLFEIFLDGAKDAQILKDLKAGFRI